ncbi:response regulator transcription factor [Bacillus sp. JZ8]
MDNIRILVADDEQEICHLIKAYLERERYKVDIARDGEKALALFRQHTYHLVILDIMMPGKDGIEVCQVLRKETNVPILMLTAKDHESDKILGLSFGADYYITKPFSIYEVVACVKALLRRFIVLGNNTINEEHSVMKYKNIEMDLTTYKVRVFGKEVTLAAKELKLLKLFLSHPERVFTKAQLFKEGWGEEYIEDDNTVMVHIRKLRKKIEKDPSDPLFIQTVWGIGYRFQGEKDEI